MTSVEIEYCVPCGHLNHAQEVQEELLEEYGQRLETVTLRTGDGGVFKVRVEDDLVFDKADNKYDVDAIVDTVGTYT